MKKSDVIEIPINSATKILGLKAVAEMEMVDDPHMFGSFLLAHAQELEKLIKHLSLKLTPEQRVHFTNACVTIGGAAMVMEARVSPEVKSMMVEYLATDVSTLNPEE